MSHVRRALLSVSDKSGLAEFAQRLSNLGFEIVSTGGTAEALRGAGLSIKEVSELTGFPELMDGRVKTLHPAIHAGLLARQDIDDQILEQYDIGWIDILVVNLYPFQATVAKPDCDFAEAIENIDIGGPAMLRSAAKNHSRVTVVVDPRDYSPVAAALAESDATALAGLRQHLARKAFAHTAHYDSAIAAYLDQDETESSPFPDPLQLSFARAETLRYGENPHQAAAVYYSDPPPPGGLAVSEQLQGKPLSYNNLADADAAVECVKSFETTACVIVKHANPCGVALGDTPVECYQRAFQTDPTSAFGGIIAFNREVDAPLAEAIIANQFVEVLIATSFSADAQQVLGRKKNVRVLATGALTQQHRSPQLKSVSGGVLVQDPDCGQAAELRLATKQQPTENQWRDLRFAWQVVKYVKSNAIVFCSDSRTLGIGAGQTSRIMSTRIAAMKAADEGLETRGAVMASDAFFPFRDGIDAAASFGISAIIQPGGSMRDEEVVAAAEEHGMAMVLTGMRHFRH